MLKTLLQKFAGSRSKSPAGRSMQRPANASVLGLSAQAQLAGVPIYPPVDNGIASVSAQVVLATQANLIKRLKILTGCRDPEFDDLYGEVLHSLANYVGLLPASQSGTHMGAGGLFRLAIELGFFVRQGCEGVLFAGRAGVEMRRDLEPRWRYATFLAGLCCELYRPLSRMIVVTGDGKEWPLHRQPLAEWLESVGAERYFVRWVPDDVAARMSALSRAVVNKVVKDYRSGALQLVSAQNEQGLAIAIEQLSSYGIELTTLLGELHGLGWLYVDPAKPGRKIHMAKIGDRLVQSAIFKEQVAIDLGFIV